MAREALDPPRAPDTHPGLSGRDYSAPGIYELERERIFFRSWLCAGRAEELPEAGDFLTREVAGESVLVVRTREGDLRAFYNVCRHRGARLCDEPAGRANRAFVCPYHSWTYALDGRLLRTPNVDEGDVDRAAHGLRPVALEAWDGFLWLNLAEKPPRSLMEQLALEAGAPLSFGRYRTGELRVGHRLAYEVRANWKILHDNFNECLHCPGLHPELVEIVPLYRRGRALDPARPDGGATLAEGSYTFTDSGRSRLPLLPDLSELDRRSYYAYTVFPNLIVNLTSTGLMTYALYPRAVDHTTVVSEYLFRPEAIAGEDFDCSDMVAFLDRVSVQDWAVCERVQQGVRSRGFVRGVYPPPDRLLHDFAERYRAERGPAPE